MPFTIDYLGDGEPLAWSLTGTADDPGWSVTRHPDYRPALYAVTATGMRSADPDPAACERELADLADRLADHPAVVDLSVERRRPGFRFAAQSVLRIEADRVDAVRTLGTFVEEQGPPGQVPYRAFNVDFAPEFRFCLEREVSPHPSRLPTVLHLALSRRAAAEEDLTELAVGADARAEPSLERANGHVEPAGETTVAALETLRDRLAEWDPDVLAVERGEIVPLVAEAAGDHGVDLGLQRVPPDCSREEVPAYQQLAGDSTFESYGQVRHSPARYNVPGRVIIDRANTFFLTETNLAGCLDLVERSHKPLQELSWASIGNVLTSIQVREARDRGVLIQWRAWRPERFKTAAQLHAGDRGGTTLSPVVGFHEDVHELDFDSLYPNIICEFNLSPETVRCRCHDRADVPELGYAVCDRDGYLPDVLRPLIDDRAEMKATLAAADEPGGPDLSAAEREALEGQVSALKWILVSCFGYQGFSNAKFGRIEVHEAINARARDILLTAKERLEAGGWRVLHGIVDSVWVTPAAPADERTPLEAIAADVTEEVGIRLEYEGAFDWVAFCPLRNGEAGALTRYFGRRRGPAADADRAADPSYKLRGIECRQRSTCEWVAGVQTDLIRALDEHRDPAAVCDRLQVRLRPLRNGEVSPRDLVITTRASKAVDDYAQRTRTVAALERAETLGMPAHAGQDVHYVVVDDDRDSMDRVLLAEELDDGAEAESEADGSGAGDDPEIGDDARAPYDVAFYTTQAVRAAESVLSPLGWDAEDVRAHLAGRSTPRLASFGPS